MTAPYPNALSFTVSKAINLPQLQNELQTALGGTTVTLALSGSGYSPPPSSISSSNQATLWVVPNTIDPTVAQTAINNHTYNANWGLPLQTQNYLNVVNSVLANNSITLSNDQMNAAVVGLILQVEQIISGNPNFG